MFFIKKKLVTYLYIFFVFLAFNFTEFSTNIATAKTFIISNIEVEEKYNVNFNKLKIIDRGFKKAFNDLSQMILERKDLDIINDTPIEDIKKIVENFTILNEKFINQKYENIMEVEFNRKKLIKFLNSKNITLSLPRNIDVFFIPVFVDLENNSFNYLNNNIFVKNWESINENYFQINYNLPNEDVEDYLIIKNNLKNIENYNFQKILKKYNFENYIIMIIFKRINEIKFYSKIKFEDKLVVLNGKLMNNVQQMKIEVNNLLSEDKTIDGKVKGQKKILVKSYQDLTVMNKKLRKMNDDIKQYEAEVTDQNLSVPSVQMHHLIWIILGGAFVATAVHNYRNL